jgi:hypothetical protein
MPLIKPDTSTAVEFVNIAPGTYKAKITACPFETSKAQNPMIVPNFDIEVEGKIMKRKGYLVITGEGAGGFSQLLRACHFDDLAAKYADKSIALADKPDFNTDDLVGQELNVVVDHQLYNGTMRDYLKAYLKA